MKRLLIPTKVEPCRTEVTNKDNRKSGHLVPDDQDVIEFQQNLTNHVKTTSPIVSLAVGTYASCAIVENTLQCWGRSDFVGGTNVSTSWVKQVRDLTPNLASTSGYTLKSPDKLLLKKVVVSKTDPTAVIPPSTSVKDKEVFCLLADDYSSFGASNSITSVIYCWGNPIGNIPNLTVGQQYPSPVSVFTANNFRILNLFVNETNLSYLTNSSSRPLSFLGGASTNVLGTVQPTALTSYSNSGVVACVLKESTPHCVGMQGYDSGDFRYNASNQNAFSQVPWNPTTMLGTNVFNSFNYDLPENPETISLTTGQQTASSITGSAITATYTQTARGTATKEAYTYTATAASLRSINSTLPVTSSPTFSKVVTLRTSACGLDTSGNVWCWGACQDTGNPISTVYPGGPGYCRYRNTTTLDTYGLGRDIYKNTTTIYQGRFTPAKVAWGAFLVAIDIVPTVSTAITAPYRKIVATPFSPLTNKSSTSDSKLSATTPYLDHVIDIFPGVYSVCALRDMGSESTPYEVFCWGWNGFGALGDGTTASSQRGQATAATATFTTGPISTNPTTQTTTTTSIATYTVTATSTIFVTLPAPTLTATSGSFIGQPTFILSK